MHLAIQVLFTFPYINKIKYKHYMIFIASVFLNFIKVNFKETIIMGRVRNKLLLSRIPKCNKMRENTGTCKWENIFG